MQQVLFCFFLHALWLKYGNRHSSRSNSLLIFLLHGKNYEELRHKAYRAKKVAVGLIKNYFRASVVRRRRDRWQITMYISRKKIQWEWAGISNKTLITYLLSISIYIPIYIKQNDGIYLNTYRCLLNTSMCHDIDNYPGQVCCCVAGDVYLCGGGVLCCTCIRPDDWRLLWRW